MSTVNNLERIHMALRRGTERIFCTVHSQSNVWSAGHDLPIFLLALWMCLKEQSIVAQAKGNDIILIPIKYLAVQLEKSLNSS
uniref:Uncharacterized protein n=1 Tax=Tetranychus urticae TaxID=32264 RepID=T1K0G4_TETUR